MAKKSSQSSSSQSAPPSPSSERVPPHSLEAEMSLLGAMMLDRQAVGEALLIAQAEDFYLPSHQQLANTLRDLYDHNVAIDLVTMLDALREKGWIEEVGGAAYLARLAESVPSAANAEHYARIVKNKAILRNFINATGALIRDAFAEGETVDEFLDRAEQAIFNVTERRKTGQAVGIKEILKETFEEIEKSAGGGLTGVPTGFYELDDILNGLQRGEMIVLAARPSHGKTSLAMNIVEHAAVDNKLPVAVFSLEMRSRDIAKRMLASRAGVNMQEMGKGHLQDEFYGKLIKAAGELAETQLFIDDTPGQTIFDIRAKSRRLKAQHNIELIVIDYLQLMQHKAAENRQVQVAEISRGIKALARELDIPVLALSQLNRSVEQEDRLPRLSDIRESGAVEQDADVVLLLHKGEWQAPDKQFASNAVVHVAKHRNGRVGYVPLNFQDSLVRFVNPAYEAAGGTPHA